MMSKLRSFVSLIRVFLSFVFVVLSYCFCVRLVSFFDVLIPHITVWGSCMFALHPPIHPPPRVTQLNSSHTTHLTQLITHRSSYTTHLTPRGFRVAGAAHREARVTAAPSSVLRPPPPLTTHHSSHSPLSPSIFPSSFLISLYFSLIVLNMWVYPILLFFVSFPSRFKCL